MEESHPQEVDIYANIIQNRRFQLPHVALASTMEGSSFQMLQLASKIEGSSCKMLQITCEKESSDYTMLQIICKIEDSSFKGLCIACKMMANRMQSVRSQPSVLQIEWKIGTARNLQLVLHWRGLSKDLIDDVLQIDEMQTRYNTRISHHGSSAITHGAGDVFTPKLVFGGSRSP